MFKLKSSKVGLISFVLASLLVAFAAAEALGQSPDKVGGGTLRIATEGDQTREMDARYLRAPTQFPAALAIYELLIGSGPKGMGDIVPVLVESWKQVDPVTYLFSLRKGVKFHNGREMIAEDVKTTLDWMLKTPAGWTPFRRRGELVRVVDKAETVDRYNLRVRLKAPFALLIPVLRVAGPGIAPPEEIIKWGKDFTLHPTGSGPFKFVELVPGDRVVLERFDGYWGKRPHLDRVVVRTIPDEQSRLVALQAGEVDVARLSSVSLPVARKDPNLKTKPIPNVWTLHGLWFNMRRWPMSSLKFRTAAVMGAEWHKFPLATAAGVVTRTSLEKTWAENPKAAGSLLPYDPERARRLIKEVEAEAGRPIPPLTILTPIWYDVAQIGTLAKTQLKRIGVELTVDVREAYFAATQALKWDLRMGASRGPGTDPYFHLTVFSSGGEGDMPDGKNVMGYVNPQMDELLKRAVVTDDRVERKKIYQEIEGVVLKDLPGLPLYNWLIVWGMNKRVQDIGIIDDAAVYVATPWNNTWLQR